MKEIVVANGEYQKQDGNTGTNWVKVGVLGVSQNGKEYIILEPHVNLAGLPRSEKGGVMCSVIDKSNQQNQQQNSAQQNYNAPQQNNYNAPQQQYNQQPQQNNGGHNSHQNA